MIKHCAGAGRAKQRAALIINIYERRVIGTNVSY